LFVLDHHWCGHNVNLPVVDSPCSH
jgi:hypothetical protein